MTKTKTETKLDTGIYIFSHKGQYLDATIGDFVESGIFEEDRNFRHSVSRSDAKKIVLIMKGIAYGHFLIRESRPAEALDKNRLPPCKRVYLVESSVRYPHPFNLKKELGLRFFNRPRAIAEQDFDRIVESGMGR